MQLNGAAISIVFDSAQAAQAVEEALSGFFVFRKIPLRDYAAEGALDAPLNIFCVILGGKETFERVKGAIKMCPGEMLFVFPSHDSAMIETLRHYSQAEYFLLPLNDESFRGSVKSALSRPVERSWTALEPVKHKALQSALVAFEKCFDQVANGEPLPIDDIKSSCQDICQAAELGGLQSWIHALDNHHDYSYRHSMFVCGSLTYFARSIGIRGSELELLTMGGLLHDIGKCRVPLEILDKPGKLDEREWEVMKLHPVHSRDILEREVGLDPETVAMAVYHHEKLDGTGYPDGLISRQINDHVRLTAIADIYSALIDKRAYKGSMSSEAALDIMLSMDYQLDMDLTRKFREFALDNG